MNTVLIFSLLFFFRARYLDSRALSKLGVYIPKPDLNSFFIRDEFDGKRERWIEYFTSNNTRLPRSNESSEAEFWLRTYFNRRQLNERRCSKGGEGVCVCVVGGVVDDAGCDDDRVIQWWR